MKYYAVYDTNVLISALLTRHSDSATAQVVDAILNEMIVPLYSQEILEEYDDVLHRSRFSFSEERIQVFMNMIQQFGREVHPTPTGEILPDMDDLIFYEVVMEKQDHDAFLITGNIHHYPGKRFVVTPAEMMAILYQKGTEDEHGKK